MKKWIALFTMFVGSLSAVAGSCCGKVDVGPVVIRTDILDSGHKVRSLDIWGAKADACARFFEFIVVKPTATWAGGDADYWTVGIGLGACIPVCDWLLITPTVGYNYSEFQSTYHYDLGFLFLPRLKIRETFKSQSPYLGFDIQIRFSPCWRLNGVFQYSFSRVHTKIHSRLIGSVRNKSNCEGPAYALQLERDLNEKWSVTAGVGYNISLTHEEHGLRGYGAKLGLVYWFGG